MTCVSPGASLPMWDVQVIITEERCDGASWELGALGALNLMMVRRIE